MLHASKVRVPTFMPPRDMGGGVDAETRARRGGERSRSAMRAGGAVAVRRPASDVDGGRGDYVADGA